ncbi:MAG: 4'-phosphopantetheinyl transferase superfamily protein [Balneolaceae bacterium]|jgi:phosphopantetheinyl transferase
MPEKLSDIVFQLPFKSSFGFKALVPISEEALDALQDYEISELNTFTNVRRKREYLSSRILLKKLASEWGIPREEFEILKDDLGSPYGLYRSERYFISIAHTRKRVFCGISRDSAIGIDAEPITRKVPDKLKRRILHPDEVRSLASVSGIRIWTIKEAFIKLEGQGLRLNMNQVKVQKEGNTFLVEINNDKRAKICSFRSADHWLAIAYYQ